MRYYHFGTLPHVLHLRPSMRKLNLSGYILHIRNFDYFSFLSSSLIIEDKIENINNFNLNTSNLLIFY